MRTRTKIVIASIVNVEALFIYMIICSSLDLSFPPSEFVIGWFSFWAVELGLLAGITIKGKDNG